MTPAPLEDRPDVLQSRIGPLWSRIEEGQPITDRQRAAVAEGFFRIGVHPSTDTATALRLLAHAHRLDSSNPKHPYHAGLIYLRNGRLEAADAWLTEAAALSPTNHRIWAHLSLTLNKLHQSQQGVPGYKKGHETRTDAITAAIVEGRDDFVPDADRPVLPLLRPGECRWSGIRDIMADGKLRGNTTERNRDILAAKLENVAGLTARRKGGTAAFTVLAVQWLVYGYPSGTIRRILNRLPSDEDRARRLLSITCDLFEVDYAELPTRLATYLAEGSLPDMLIALIHRQRLFWRPLRFPDLGAHAAARRFTDGNPSPHENALRDALKRLSDGRRASIPDAQPAARSEEPATAGHGERLALIEVAARQLDQLRENMLAHAKKALSTEAMDSETSFARVLGDHETLTELLDRWEHSRQAWLDELQRFKDTEPSDSDIPFEEFQQRLEDCAGQLQTSCNPIRKNLDRKVAPKLKKMKDEFAGCAPAPSEHALDLAKSMSELENRHLAAAPTGKPPGATTAPSGSSAQDQYKALSADPPASTPDAQLAADSEEPAAGHGERLVLLKEATRQLDSLRQAMLDHAKELDNQAVDSETGFAQVLGDHEILTGLLDRWEHSRQAWLKELQRFMGTEPSNLDIPFEEFQQRVQDCEGQLKNSTFGPIRKNLDRKVAPKLAKKEGEFAGCAPAPSEHALDLAKSMSELENRHPAAASAGQPSGATAAASGSLAQHPDQAVSPPPLPLDAGERARVAYTLDAAERRFDANFAEAWRTLDAYPPELKHRPAVMLLRAYLAGHQAEADLRMGRIASALRQWNGMLADDPLHPATLRNLAVAHTTSGDPGQGAQAWRRYLEALYIADLLDGDIRGAGERAQIHHILAGSFGTATLTARLALDGESDEALRQVPFILASVSKVAITTAHLRLEELNHVLSHRGPALLLGVARSAKEAELTAARDARVKAVESAVRLLPEQVRAPFEKLCLRTIDEAYRDASKTSGRTRRPQDEAEEQAHMEWARGRMLWKMRIAKAARNPKADWVLTEYSGEVIRNLRLIDELSLDTRDQALLQAVQQMGVTADPAEFIEQYNHLSEIACDFAIGQILETAGQATSDPQAHHFPEQFRRVGRSWGRNDIPQRYLDFLDDPQRLYVPSARSAFDILQESGVPADDRERGIVAAAVTALNRWVERLPGATGPARFLARFLETLERYDEADEVLSRARDDAFSPQGRHEISVSFARLGIARGQFADAVNQIRELLSADSDDEQLRNLLTGAYNRWISSGKNIPEPTQISEDFARWTDAETAENRRLLTVNAAMARHQTRQDSAGIGPLTAELRTLCAQDPENTEACYHLVIALYQLTVEIREQVRSSAGSRRRTLRDQQEAIRRECELRCEELVRTGALSEERLERIRQILRRIRPEPR